MLACTLCNDALPSNVRLHRRIENHLPDCPIRGFCPEYDLHIFRDCREVKLIWKRMGMCIDKSAQSLLDWISLMELNLDKDNFALFLTLLCAIWDRRNTLVIAGVQGLLDGINEGKTQKIEKIPPDRSHWSPPVAGWYKLNADAYVMEGKGSGLGVCIRDDKGFVVGACTKQLQTRYDPLVDETKAVSRGLQLVVALQLNKVVVESDCNDRKSNWPVSISFLLLKDIMALSNYCDEVKWVYVPRCANNDAHEIARCEPWVHGLRMWDKFDPFGSTV